MEEMLSSLKASSLYGYHYTYQYICMYAYNDDTTVKCEMYMFISPQCSGVAFLGAFLIPRISGKIMFRHVFPPRGRTFQGI